MKLIKLYLFPQRNSITNTNSNNIIIITIALIVENVIYI